MQKTVIILVRTPDVDLPEGQPLVITIDGSLKGAALANAGQRKRADKSTIRNESAPAFWTWFVENPRPNRRVSP